VGTKCALKARCRFGMALLACLALPAYGEAVSGKPAEARTAAQFRLIRSQSPLLWAFLKEMPKGGDLHSHLSGAVYAESMIRWAAEDGLCVDQRTLALAEPPCDEARGQAAAESAQRDSVLYRRMIDAWSMRNQPSSGLSGHDLFFDSFGKFGHATSNRKGDMLAEAASHAGAGRVSYLELMLTPASSETAKVAAKSGWNDDFGKMRAAMLEHGLPEAVRAASHDLSGAEARQREILSCGTAQADPGCAVTVRYLYQVLRGMPKESVFAQMLAGFELASADSRVVGLNLVMPEDALVPMRDFSLHMRLLEYLHRIYPKVHITLHAGELIPGLVPPEGLRFHIRESIEVGHAERIGHGVAVMQEDDALGLLRKMARNKILVEVCLTSNDGILGVRGARHPLSAYLKYGVPVALATDDEGVSRSEMTSEYLKAVEEQHVDYRQLKTMARNSLHYAFVEGAPLWKDIERLSPVAACAGDRNGAKKTTARCRAYLEQNPKARLQWELEGAFAAFERRY
jgi:adenosine deaminase